MNGMNARAERYRISLCYAPSMKDAKKICLPFYYSSSGETEKSKILNFTCVVQRLEKFPGRSNENAKNFFSKANILLTRYRRIFYFFIFFLSLYM